MTTLGGSGLGPDVQRSWDPPMDAPAESPAPGRRPTLRTIADETGLSISTVSRALRRDAHTSATAAVVHAAAERLGYFPDPVAASLRDASRPQAA